MTRHEWVGKVAHWELCKKAKLKKVKNKKRIRRNEDFAVPADNKVKKKKPRKERPVSRPRQRTKKPVEHAGDGDCTGN